MKDKSKTHLGEVQLVIFKLGVEEFGVEINQVREIVRVVPITPIPRAPDFIEGVVNLRGQILAVIDLAKRMNLPQGQHTEKTRIVVVEVVDNVVGMIVDEVSEVLRLPLENIEAAPEIVSSDVAQKYLKGVGKLEDRLLILLDLGRIFSSEEMDDLRKTKIVPGAAEDKE